MGSFARSAGPLRAGVDEGGGAGYRRSVVGPTGGVALASLVVLLVGLRGPDYPTHFFRAELWRTAGFAVWDAWWFTGHSTPSYSVLVPPLAAALGPVPLAALSAVAATWMFSDLHWRLVGTRAVAFGNALFAFGAIDNVIIGRTTFVVGFAIAIAAAWAWQRGWVPVAVVAAICASLASPVAGVFLGIVAAGVVVDALWTMRASTPRRTSPSSLLWSGLAVGTACAVPLLLVAVRYGSEGHFSFPVGLFVVQLLVLASAWMIMAQRVARIVLVIAGVACVVFFAVPNALAGNFVRFGNFVVVPVAAAQWFGRVRVDRRAALAALASFAALFWVGTYTVRAVRWWAVDPSTSSQFYDELVVQIHARSADGLPAGRVEIPFTSDHWETYYVAVEAPYPRGWERQLDVARNAVLYDPPLDWPTYRQWLDDNAVRWVAVPSDDVPIDRGGRPEVELIAGGGASDLVEVWSDPNWTLYEVDDYTPIVGAHGTLVEQAPDAITIEASEPGPIEVRYRFTDAMRVGGGATLEPTGGGWFTIDVPAPGVYTITVPAP